MKTALLLQNILDKDYQTVPQKSSRTGTLFHYFDFKKWRLKNKLSVLSLFTFGTSMEQQTFPCSTGGHSLLMSSLDEQWFHHRSEALSRRDSDPCLAHTAGGRVWFPGRALFNAGL